jgi:hypothetical protein
MKNQSVKTFLPIFNGFYGTIWASDNQLENEVYYINQERKDKGYSPIEYDSIDFDNEAYESEVSQRLCHLLEQELSDYVTKIAYEKLVSPKTYNFSNDSIDVIIEVKAKEVKKYIYKNIESFKKYLKDNYTSYDGFMSHYDNDFESWQSMTKDFTNFSVNGHVLGSILHFIALNEGINEFSLYENLEVYVTEFIKNYDTLGNPSCDKCHSIIQDDNIINDYEKYKKVIGEIPTVFCPDCLEVYTGL